MTKQSLFALLALTVTVSSSTSLMGMRLSDQPDQVEKSRKMRQNSGNPLARITLSNLLGEVERSTEIRGDTQIYPTQTGTETIPSLKGSFNDGIHPLQEDTSLLQLLDPSTLLAQQIGLDRLPQNGGSSTNVIKLIPVRNSVEGPVSIPSQVLDQSALQTKRNCSWTTKNYKALYMTLKTIDGDKISKKELAEKLSNAGIDSTENSIEIRITRIKQGKISPQKVGTEYYDELLTLLKEKVQNRTFRNK